MKRIVRKIILCACIALFSGAAIPARAADLAVGGTAPDFNFTAPDGRTVRLSSLRGKPVALHFWASWCGPCVKELPLISQLEASKPGDIAVLAVNCAETDQAVSSFLSGRKIRISVVMDRDYTISRLYKVSVIPQTYLIDADGVIRSIQVGAYTQAGLNRDIAALLN